MSNTSDLLVTMSVDEMKALVAEEVAKALLSHLKPPTPLKVYPIKEAADLLGVHFHTARLYCNKGLIDSFKVGNRDFVTLEAIQAFVAKGGSSEPTQKRAYK